MSWKLKFFSEAFSKICSCITRKHKQPEDKEGLQQHYFDLGTDYYVAGRFAVFARLIPTAGNLFHHAIEMYLKGQLCRQLDESGRIRLGHSLKRNWKAFKKAVNDPGLNKYDKLVAELDRFESIRYPEKTSRLGMMVQFGITRSVPGHGTSSASPPSYEVVVNEIDELVAEILGKVSVNPAFLTRCLSEDGKAYLLKDNATALWR